MVGLKPQCTAQRNCSVSPWMGTMSSLGQVDMICQANRSARQVAWEDMCRNAVGCRNLKMGREASWVIGASISPMRSWKISMEVHAFSSSMDRMLRMRSDRVLTEEGWKGRVMWPALMDLKGELFAEPRIPMINVDVEEGSRCRMQWWIIFTVLVAVATRMKLLGLSLASRG